MADLFTRMVKVITGQLLPLVVMPSVYSLVITRTWQLFRLHTEGTDLIAVVLRIDNKIISMKERNIKVDESWPFIFSAADKFYVELIG